jgi:hypothetical protein
MKGVPRLVAAEDAVRSGKNSASFIDRYGAASQKITIANCIVLRAPYVAVLILLAAFSSSHKVVNIVQSVSLTRTCIRVKNISSSFF